MIVERGGRQILLHGLALVFAALAWGFVVPMTPHPRLALTAHIQLAMNGLLFLAMATLLLKFRHQVARWSVGIMVLSAWLTWAMALSEIANAWWGTRRILPIAASQAGAGGAEPWQETLLAITHLGSGIGVLVAWGLLLAGFWKARGEAA